MITRVRKHRLNKAKAQSTLEYAVVVACVVAALLGMQFYIRRGIQGKLRQAADETGEQYTPLNVDSNITTQTTSTTTVTQSLTPLNRAPGVPLNDEYDLPVYGIKTDTSIDETTTKDGQETLGEFENGLF
ncbi:MAG: hypothetical protein PHG87_07220 [Candidatus Omnitrophica bacterium]|nr:hypothetical protein [Candidatus Omnitrophota bacterium]